MQQANTSASHWWCEERGCGCVCWDMCTIIKALEASMSMCPCLQSPFSSLSFFPCVYCHYYCYRWTLTQILTFRKVWMHALDMKGGVRFLTLSSISCLPIPFLHQIGTTLSNTSMAMMTTKIGTILAAIPVVVGSKWRHSWVNHRVLDECLLCRPGLLSYQHPVGLLK